MTKNNQLGRDTNEFGTQFAQCRWCENKKWCVLLPDPYDYASGSPIVSHVIICRACYMDRSLGAFEFAFHQGKLE